MLGWLSVAVCGIALLMTAKPCGAADTVVVLETTQGPIEVRLFAHVAPRACENFVGLVRQGYYDGISFHRIIKNFMIQGGDPSGTGAGGTSLWGEPFADEVHKDIRFDRPGIFAMANAGPNTNGSQFFITTVPTPWLHMKHTIFGEVSAGYEAVEKLSAVATGANDRPRTEQKIIRAYVKE